MRKWTKKKKRNTTSQNHHNYKHHQQQATTVNYLESRCTSSCETSTLPWMDWLSSVIKDRIRGEFMLFQWFRLSICPLSVHALNNFYSKRGEQWCLQNCTNSNLLKLHKELGSIMTTSNSKDWQYFTTWYSTKDWSRKVDPMDATAAKADRVERSERRSESNVVIKSKSHPDERSWLGLQ